MKIVIIDKKDIACKIEKSTIKIEQQSIPFKHMDLLILNHRITLQTNDLLSLTNEGISVLIVSHSSDKFSLVHSLNAKNTELKYAQYKAHEEHLTFAKEFIVKKITSHKEQLVKNGIELSIDQELQNLQNATSTSEVMGIEGAFAVRYFKEYFPLLPSTMHKSTRSKQPPRDPVNALLSYWYKLYYNIITAKLISYGFEPALGYLHKPFREHYALSSDLIELFRAEINEAVIHIFTNSILTTEDFSKKGGVYLRFDGRKKVWSHFLALCEVLKPKLDAEIAYLKKMIYERQNIIH